MISRSMYDITLGLVWREAFARYRHSMLGWVWMIITPLLMLLIYTFVFGFVFKSRWPEIQTGPLDYSVILFSGLIFHAFLGDSLIRSSHAITGNPNFIKKVVYPAEMLVVVSVSAAFLNSFVQFIVLCLLMAFLDKLHFSMLFVSLPIWVYFYVLTLALSLLVASIAVYARDLQQFIPFLMTILMFTAPICYPLDAVPEKYRDLLFANPLTAYVEGMRSVLFMGRLPKTLFSPGLALMVFALFMVSIFVFGRLKKGFADVV